MTSWRISNVSGDDDDFRETIEKGSLVDYFWCGFYPGILVKNKAFIQRDVTNVACAVSSVA